MSRDLKVAGNLDLKVFVDTGSMRTWVTPELFMLIPGKIQNRGSITVVNASNRSVTMPERVKEVEMELENKKFLQEVTEMTSWKLPADMVMGHDCLTLHGLMYDASGHQLIWKEEFSSSFNANSGGSQQLIQGEEQIFASTQAHFDMMALTGGHCILKDPPGAPPEDQTHLLVLGEKSKNEVIELIEDGATNEEIVSCLENHFPTTFQTGMQDDSPSKQVAVEIKPDSTPVRMSYMRLGHTQLTALAAQLEKLVKEGRVEKSATDWASPVFMVPKKNNKWRLVVDFRRLNKVTIPKMYRLPRIQEVIDGLYGCCYFTTIDLSDGYWQLSIRPEDRNYFGVTTPLGNYRFISLPMGWVNSAAHFQAYMEKLFSNVPHVKVYQDDIIIATRTKKEHELALRKVFKILADNNLTVKREKLKICQPSVEILGFTVEGERIRPARTNLDKILTFPEPNSRKALRSFLGSIRFYQAFIPNFTDIINPLQRIITEKVPFLWTKAQQDAFKLVHTSFMKVQELQIPNIQGTFEIYLDASRTGIGSVLHQDNKPVSYHSRVLKEAELSYSVTDIETLALVEAVTNFGVYLQGKQTVVYTDHQPLTYLLTKDTCCLREKEKRWLTKIMEFAIDIVYVPGEANCVADQLSRRKFTLLDVCSGIGTTCLALAKLELETVVQYLSCEINPQLRQVARSNFNHAYANSEMLLPCAQEAEEKRTDIRQLLSSPLPKIVDLVVLTPPCTPYSRANPQAKGDGFHVICIQIIKRLKKHNPQVKFMIENVIFTDKALEARNYLDKEVSALGGWRYKVDMALFVPTTRKRFIWTNVHLPLHRTNPTKTTWQDVLDPDGKTEEKLSPTLCSRLDTYSERNTKAHVVSSLSGRKRTMTIDERERLHGFPVGSTRGLTKQVEISMESRIAAIGNSVPLPFMEYFLTHALPTTKWSQSRTTARMLMDPTIKHQELHHRRNQWSTATQVIEEILKILEADKIDVDLCASKGMGVKGEKWQAFEVDDAMLYLKDVDKGDKRVFFINPPYQPVYLAKQLTDSIARKLLDLEIRKFAILVPEWIKTPSLERCNLVCSYPEGSHLFVGQSGRCLRTKWKVNLYSAPENPTPQVDFWAMWEVPENKKIELTMQQCIGLARKIHSHTHMSERPLTVLMKKWFEVPVGQGSVNAAVKAARVHECPACLLTRPNLSKQQYRPIISWKIGETLTMDFCSIAKSKVSENDSVLVFTEKLTRFVLLIEWNSNNSADDLARTFITRVYPLLGVPQRIISDQDTLMTSHVWKEFTKALDVSVQFTATNNPQADGATEVANRKMILQLIKSIDRHDNWELYLPLVQVNLNNTPNSVTGIPPAECIFRQVQLPLFMWANAGGVPEQQNFLEGVPVQDHVLKVTEKLQELEKELVERTIKEAHRMVNLRDRKQSFEVGSTVCFQRERKSSGRKLLPKLVGPATVLEVRGNGGHYVLKYKDHTINRNGREVYSWPQGADEWVNAQEEFYEPLNEVEQTERPVRITRRVWSEEQAAPTYVVKLANNSSKVYQEKDLPDKLVLGSEPNEVNFDPESTEHWAHRTLLRSGIRPSYEKGRKNLLQKQHALKLNEILASEGSEFQYNLTQYRSRKRKR